MSIEALSHVLSARIGDTTSKLVLLAYANHASKDGTAAWPGKAAVADYAECDPKTVQRHLRKLEANGWLRRGDQELVSHLRADRRPVVYDVAMSETVRATWQSWAASAADTGADVDQAGRVDTTPPRESSDADDGQTERVDTLHPPPGAARVDTSDPHGGTSETSRGDTAVSPKPSRTVLGTVQSPPSPAADASGATTSTGTTDAVPAVIGVGCAAHPHGALGCRPCGTSPRQLAGAAKRAEADQARAAAQRSLQLQRDQNAARLADPAKARESLAAARAAAERARATSPLTAKATR